MHRILTLLFFMALPYVQAAGPCASCHPKEVAGYRETGMGRSMSRSVSQPPGRFRHAISKTEVTLRSRPQGMIHRLEQDGLVAEYPTDYVIGSGNATFGLARRQARDSGHSAFTDHRISRRPARDPKAAEEPSRRPSRQRLRAWREPPAQWTQRNLGIAYVKVGEKEHSVFHFREGRRRLLAVKDRFARDAAVVSALGLATMHLAGEGGADSPKAALAFFEQAVALEPDQVLNYPQLAAAWWELGEASEAIAQLERAIELDPYFETAYHMLAHICGQTQRPELVRRTWRQYQRFRPQSIAAGLALRRLGSGESDSAP